MGTVTLEIYPKPGFGGVFYIKVDANEVVSIFNNNPYEVDDDIVEEWIDAHLKNVDSWDVAEYPNQ